MVEKQATQKKLEDMGIRKMPDFTLSFKSLTENKWVKIGLYKREGKEGWSRKTPVEIPAGTYINMFKVEPLPEKNLKDADKEPDHE